MSVSFWTYCKACNVLAPDYGVIIGLPSLDVSNDPQPLSTMLIDQPVERTKWRMLLYAASPNSWNRHNEDTPITSGDPKTQNCEAENQPGAFPGKNRAKMLQIPENKGWHNDLFFFR